MALLVVAASAAALGFNTWKSEGGYSCTQGRLFNAGAGQGPGRMIGTITGDYWIESIGGPSHPEKTPAVFTIASSRVDGERGPIRFSEYWAIDFTESVGINGALILLVTGDPGQWKYATGHIALSGYFHTDKNTGVWDYQGEVCVP